MKNFLLPCTGGRALFRLGEWAIHCHLLYHMSAGMMNKLIVANVDGNSSDLKNIVAQPQANDKGVNQHANH